MIANNHQSPLTKTVKTI